MRKYIDKAIRFILCSMLIIMVSAACWQVFTRFVLKDPSGITEELLRYMLIWMSMVGGAYAYGQDKHLAIVFVVKKFDERMQNILAILVDLIVILFSSIILIYGGYVAFVNAIGQISTALRMPMQYLYLSLIIAGLLFLMYAILNIIKSVKKYNDFVEVAK